MPESKLICGVPHVQVPCRRCEGLIWVSRKRINSVYNGLGSTCYSCLGLTNRGESVVGVKRAIHSEQYHGELGRDDI